MVGEAVLQIFLLIIGFVLLVKGADFFVDGASGIAEKLHVSTFVIGLTIVAVGTSLPEAAISIISGISHTGDMLVGNAIGSNILNILLILGIASLICKIPVEKSSQRIEIPFLILITLIFIGLGYWKGGYQWYDGLILLLLYGLFMTYTIMMARRTRKLCPEGVVAEQIQTETETEVITGTKTGVKAFFAKVSFKYNQLKEHTWFLLIITICGAAMVVGGAQLVKTSATYIAQDLFGIPVKIVSLTVVAFATSLPELVTSISAARKGDMGIATGNIIGSNIANLLLVAGLGFLCGGSYVTPFDTTIDLIDAAVSLGAALVLLLSSINKDRSLNRITGIIMLLCLCGYYSYLFVTRI